MEEEQRCANCHYYRHNESECRKSPPVGILEQIADGKVPTGKWYWEWNWPAVSPDDWCGEWGAFK